VQKLEFLCGKRLNQVCSLKTNDLQLTGPYRNARQIQVNGDFDACLDRLLRADAIAPRPVVTIPLDVPGFAVKHQGMCERKPWEYEVAVCIPTLNAAERLKLILSLYRLQTAKPYIILVDCGSNPRQFKAVEKLRAQDVEVHSLRLNGISNSSEVVSMAQDVALSVCQSRFLFSTHDDCFPTSQILLQYFRDLCSTTKVCGHQLTPRPHDDWNQMFGHTALMIDVGFALDKGLTWNMRRGMRRFGMNTVEGDGWTRPNLPDTETGFNYLVQAAGVKPFFTGTERNWQRNTDGLIDHCRSAASSALYNHVYQTKKNRPWLEKAMRDAKKRIREWTENVISEVPPLPVPPVPPVQKLPGFTKGRV
jgi:hypothetical protein